MAQCVRMFSWRIFPVFSRHFYLSSSETSVEREIRYACNKGRLNEAIEHLRSMIANDTVPSQSSLGTVLHACQRTSDSNGESIMDEILSYSQRIDNPDMSLASAQISCLLSYGRVNDVWNLFQNYSNKGITLREKTLTKLLSVLMNQKDIKKIQTAFGQAKDKGLAIPVSIGQQILSEAIADGNSSEDWRDMIWELLQVYRDRRQLVEAELAPVLIKWFERERNGCKTTTIVPTESGMATSECSACGHQLEYGISKQEQTMLLNYTREALERETQYFEDHQIEDNEIKYFMNFVKRSGPYGAIIDGMNVSHLRSVGNIVRVSRDMLNLTKKPVMVIVRNHIMNKIKPLGSRTRSSLSKRDIVRQFSDQGIDLFHISNRVADDKYFIHAALSHPTTLIVTNDKLGDYSHQLPSESLKKIFEKWLISHQTKIEITNQKKVYKVPPKHNKVIQWTPDTVHVPLDNGDWICITRTNTL